MTMEDEKKAELVERARTVISETGWTQDQFIDSQTGSVCIQQALREAGVHVCGGRGVAHDVVEDLEYHLCEDLTGWNDTKGRMKDEVDGLLALFSKRYRSEVT